MRTHVLIAGALALAATVTSANALTIVNGDKTDHTFMLTPAGGKQQTVMLKASATENFDCAKGCRIHMGAKDISYTGKVAKVWIKDGKFTTL